MDELRRELLYLVTQEKLKAKALLGAYRKMTGNQLPFAKFGYTDPIIFLKERFEDYFLFQGDQSNPILSLKDDRIVPSTNKTKEKEKKLPNLDSVEIKKASNKTKKTVKLKPKNPELKEVPEPSTSAIYDKSKRRVIKKSEKICVQDSDENCFNGALEKYHSKGRPCHQHEGNHITYYRTRPCYTTNSLKLYELKLKYQLLKQEVKQLILDYPEGVRFNKLTLLYSERYNRSLNIWKFGFCSLISFVMRLEPEIIIDPYDNSLLQDARRVRKLAPPPTPPPLPPPPPVFYEKKPYDDTDDALPGIPYDRGVFPSKYIKYEERIPALPLDDFEPGAMIEVKVGQVNSPSHFWLIRLGNDFEIALENMKDDMWKHFKSCEGKKDRLTLGAMRVGHYLCCLYERSWHRSLVLAMVDSDTAKLLHVDHGRVVTATRDCLRPLCRRWATFPAQAVRACLAACKPIAANGRWSRKSAIVLRGLVSDMHLVANIVATDYERNMVEAFLIDTSMETDVSMSSELVHTGLADPREDSALLARTLDTRLPDCTELDCDKDIRSVLTLSLSNVDAKSEVSDSSEEEIPKPVVLKYWAHYIDLEF